MDRNSDFMILPDFMVPEGLVAASTVFNVMAEFEPLFMLTTPLAKR